MTLKSRKKISQEENSEMTRSEDEAQPRVACRREGVHPKIFRRKPLGNFLEISFLEIRFPALKLRVFSLRF